MRHVDIKDKLPELLAEAPDWSAFVRVGDLTKLRRRSDGSFYRANYESGLLLYALVRRFHAEEILEVGTGRGFGALCMAMALRDAGTGGRIVSVDVKGYDEKQEWPIDEAAGEGPRVARLSLREVWEKHFDPALLARITLERGSSLEVLARLSRRGALAPDFVYIDGDHSWPVVRHDFHACYLLARRPFRMLLDDYSPRSDLYGVREVVHRDIAPYFDVEAIYTDQRWHGGTHAAAALDEADHAQVLVDSQRPGLGGGAPSRFKARRIAALHRRFARPLEIAHALRVRFRAARSAR
jgi:hypothetical protein